jgi:UDP-2,3-diacylglucosamine pyrophosphatase LpxH
MPDGSDKKPVELPEDKSVIVVSDLHLGAFKGSKTHGDFNSFLYWIKRLCTPEINGVFILREFSTPETKLPERELKPPEMIILLGDIVDLWVHRGHSRSDTFKDSYGIFLKLFTLPVDLIVYVMGNHDTEIREVAGEYFQPRDKKRIIIAEDSYPEEKGTGLKSGQYIYTFKHGHQLDPSFVYTGTFSEFPGWVSNNEAAFRAHPGLRWGPLAVVALGILYFLSSFFFNMTVIPPWLFLIFVFLVGASSLLVILSIPVEILNTVYQLYSTSWIQKIVNKFSRTILHDPKYRSIAFLTKNRNLASTMLSGQINAVVFGHTHLPDDYTDDKKVHYLNSGSWVADSLVELPKDIEQRYFVIGTDRIEDISKPFTREYVYNSFVYIDNDGPLVLAYDATHKSVNRVLIQRA